eukprot:scaffold8721_cov80-Phaeocystis_antarctica.AAC.29
MSESSGQGPLATAARRRCREMTKRCLHCFVRIHALFFSPPREIDSVCPSACLLASASALWPWQACMRVSG